MSNNSQRPGAVYSSSSSSSFTKDNKNSELINSLRNLSLKDYQGTSTTTTATHQSNKTRTCFSYSHPPVPSIVADKSLVQTIPQEDISSVNKFINGEGENPAKTFRSGAENFKVSLGGDVHQKNLVNEHVSQNQFITRIPDMENLASSCSEYRDCELDCNPVFQNNYSQIFAPHCCGLGTCSQNNLQNSHYDDDEYQILDASHQVVMLAMSEQGSGYLQILLQYGEIDAAELLKAVLGSIIELITGRYGHCLFNKLVERCDHFQLGMIVYTLKPYLVPIACSRYGSYSIQKLIAQVKDMPMLASAITSTLASSSLELMTSGKGKHVFRHCLALLNASDTRVLYEATLSNWFELAKDPNGCLSLNICIDFIPSPYRACLLAAIVEDSACLSFDPSGTFVVQHVLGLRDPVLNNEICRKLKGTYVRLSHVQHGSHVIQKCLVLSSLGIFLLVEELLKGKDMLEKLAVDQFGNFVIQTAIAVSQKHPKLQGYFEKNLRQLEPWIKNTRYGVHVIKELNSLPGSCE